MSRALDTVGGIAIDYDQNYQHELAKYKADKEPPDWAVENDLVQGVAIYTTEKTREVTSALRSVEKRGFDVVSLGPNDIMSFYDLVEKEVFARGTKKFHDQATV